MDMKKDNQKKGDTGTYLGTLPQEYRKNQDSNTQKNPAKESFSVSMIDEDFYNKSKKHLRATEGQITEETVDQFEKGYIEDLRERYNKIIEQNRKMKKSEEPFSEFIKKRPVSALFEDKLENKRYIASTRLKASRDTSNKYGYLIIRRKGDEKQKAKFDLKFLDGNFLFENEQYKDLNEISEVAEDMDSNQTKKYLEKLNKQVKGKKAQADDEEQQKKIKQTRTNEEMNMITKKRVKQNKEDMSGDEDDSF